MVMGFSPFRQGRAPRFRHEKLEHFGQTKVAGTDSLCCLSFLPIPAPHTIFWHSFLTCHLEVFMAFNCMNTYIHTFWHFYLTFFLAYTLTFYPTFPGIYSDILLGIYSDILFGIYLTFYLASFQAFILALYLASILTFSLTWARGWGPAVPTDIWSSRLGSRRRRRRGEGGG